MVSLLPTQTAWWGGERGDSHQALSAQHGPSRTRSYACSTAGTQDLTATTITVNQQVSSLTAAELDSKPGSPAGAALMGRPCLEASPALEVLLGQGRTLLWGQ